MIALHRVLTRHLDLCAHNADRDPFFFPTETARSSSLAFKLDKIMYNDNGVKTRAAGVNLLIALMGARFTTFGFIRPSARSRAMPCVCCNSLITFSNANNSAIEIILISLRAIRNARCVSYRQASLRHN